MKYAAGLAILALALASCSSGGERKSATAAPREPESKGVSMKDSRTVSTVAIVQALDPDKRTITLRDTRGEMMTFKVDDRVKNYSQIQVGDQVAIEYFESMAVEVVKPGKAFSEKDVVVDSAPAGQKPAGALAQSVTVTATIEKIDKSAPSITLRDPDGNLITVRVRHPERLDKVQVGDHLRITYSEAVAVSVQPAPAQVR